MNRKSANAPRNTPSSIRRFYWAFGAVIGAIWLAVIGYNIYFGVTMWPRNWTPANIKHSEIAGSAIVADLEGYRQLNGTYPQAIATIGEYPKPPAGMQRWEYRTDGDHFRLAVNGSMSGYPFLYYESNEGEWTLDE